MIHPPRWTEAELLEEQRRAMEGFRRERIDEPLESYLHAFDARRAIFQELLDRLLVPGGPQAVAENTFLELLEDQPRLEALRHLAAPPISSDDLKVLAEVPSLSPTFLRRDADACRRLASILQRALDPRRFP